MWRWYAKVRSALARCTVRVRKHVVLDGRQCDGLYDPETNTILLRRSVLERSVDEAVLVVLHEAIHAAGVVEEVLVNEVLDRLAFRSASCRYAAAKRILEALVRGESEPEED